MSRLKKVYCSLSVIFAVFAVIVTLVLSGQDVYATANSQAGDAAGTVNRTNGAADEEEVLPEDIGEPDVTRSEGDASDVASRRNAGQGLSISYNNEEGTISGTIKALLVLTVLSLAPSLLMMLTSFTRIVIVLHFVRTAIGTQTVPPNQVMMGLALILTFFIMAPIFSEINETAIQPFDKGEITQEEAIEIGGRPIREFMNGQTRSKDLDLFIEISGNTYESYDEVPFSVLIPSFIISELRTAFTIGFLIYIPFIVIDMVVASILMSMGMMMLPPTTISMPFKILLFILADGWNLVIGSLVKTFY